MSHIRNIKTEVLEYTDDRGAQYFVEHLTTLAHNAHQLIIEGESYRRKTTPQRGERKISV